MSITSQGYYVQCVNGGQFLRSTVVVEPRFWDDAEANAKKHSSPRATDRAPGSAEDATGSSAVGPAQVGEEDALAPSCGVVQQQQHRPIFAHDAPRRRLHSKSPASQLMTAQAMRELQEEEELTAWQHSNLREMVEEDSQRLKTGEISENELMVCVKAVEEAGILEYVMQDRRQETPRLRSMEAFVQSQVLQTRTVSMEEVKSLTSGPVTPITREEYEQLKAQGVKMETPMKAVATEKPSKLKARIVCGNYTELTPEGACPMTTRALVHTAAVHGWELGSLAAPDPEDDGDHSTRRAMEGELRVVRFRGEPSRLGKPQRRNLEEAHLAVQWNGVPSQTHCGATPLGDPGGTESQRVHGDLCG